MSSRFDFLWNETFQRTFGVRLGVGREMYEANDSSLTPKKKNPNIILYSTVSRFCVAVDD